MEYFAESGILELSSSFENDSIFEFIDLEETSSPGHNRESHYSPGTEESTEQAKDGAADTSKFSFSKPLGEEIEERLWSALRDYASSVTSRCADSLMDDEHLQDDADLHSPQVHQSPFDPSLPSPPRTPNTRTPFQSPTEPLADRFECLALQRNRSRSPPYASTSRISKIPKKTSTSPTMQTTNYHRPARYTQYGRSAMMLDLAQAGHHYTYTPPHSASYKIDGFSRNYGVEAFAESLDASIPSGYYVPNHTPVEISYIERLASNPNSSLDEMTFAGYDTSSQLSEQTWRRNAMRQQKPALPSVQSMSSMGLGISGTGFEGNVGVAPSMLSKMPAPSLAPINGLLRTSSQPLRNASTGSHASPRTVVPAYLQHNIADRECGAASASSNVPPLYLPMPISPPIDPQQLYPVPAYNFPGEQSSPELAQASQYYAERTSMMAAKHRSRDDSSHQHRRCKSGTHNRRKNSSGSKRQPSVGFVNWTPDDSSKILNGVAPSGSSRTKARRDKEAAERLRKQIEAAKKAVEKAGGDIGIFHENGLAIKLEGMDV
jgi:hypothetical protein